MSVYTANNRFNRPAMTTEGTSRMGWPPAGSLPHLAIMKVSGSARHSMNYPDSVQFLYALGNEIKTAKLGLDRIRTVLAALGNPQDRLRFVHVAGTNGKGSTCAMIEAGLRADGQPHGPIHIAAPGGAYRADPHRWIFHHGRAVRGCV